MTTKDIKQLNYASLMKRAERAVSRKEALDLIHAATRLLEKM